MDSNWANASREALAQLESIDSGKPYEVALADDIDGTIQQFEYYAGFATKINGKTTQISNDLVSYTFIFVAKPA